MNSRSDEVESEAARVLAENRRREQEVPVETYSPWHLGAQFTRSGVKRTAPWMLKRCGVFPVRGDPCLEVGLGRRGWIPELLEWGQRARDLCGIDLDPERIGMARETFPGADLRIGDARALPWGDESFHLVILSTILSSILISEARQTVATEAVRVLKPGGAVLYYDFRFDNPTNPNVCGIKKSEIGRLFSSLDRHLRLTTLVPPIGRSVAPLSWVLATCLEAIPVLRSHYVGVMVKNA